MRESTQTQAIDDSDVPVETVRFDFAVGRRDFLQALGAGLLIAVTWSAPAEAQEAGQQRVGGGGRGRGGGTPVKLASRVHIGQDGIVTVMTGKVECGQGARAELTQVAAEELRLPLDRVRLVMADTSLVPDDGITAGSGTTPRTVPAIRHACAAARELLVGFAATTWGADRAKLTVVDGHIVPVGVGGQALGYVDLASAADSQAAFEKPVGNDVRHCLGRPEVDRHELRPVRRRPQHLAVHHPRPHHVRRKVMPAHDQLAPVRPRRGASH